MICLKMIEPSGNEVPAGRVSARSAPKAVAFMLTRTIGWCALDPLSVPLVTESTSGKREYEANGCTRVTRLNNCASEEMISLVELWEGLP